MKNFLLVGGGVAAHQAAKGILATDGNARITMVSTESHLPYDRPHLSKAFLHTSAMEPEYLPRSEIYNDSRVTLMRQSTVSCIDRPSSVVRLDDESALPYDRLILATGSRARSLPADVARVAPLYLRTFEDAHALRRKLVGVAKVVIIGGGFIGLEVAAAACKLGCKPVVIEAQDHLLHRAASRQLSEWILRIHVSNGVDIQLGTALSHLDRLDSGKTRVETSAGKMEADIVVAGIGVQPNVELAAACGLEVNDGIVVDHHCGTSDAHIFAAGEVTNYPIRQLGIRMRTESWMAASEQGTVAGRVAAGDSTAEYSEMPWLWSDQFDNNIQFLGSSRDSVAYTCLGDLESREWLVLGWNVRSQLVNAVAVNKGREMSALRRLIKRGEPLPNAYLDAAPLEVPHQHQ